MSTLKLAIEPEFFRLPTRGVDPYFGLSRAYYYELDATGQVLLVRLRKRGSQRGVTLVNYAAVSSFLQRAAKITSQPDSILADESPKPSPADTAGNIHRITQRFPDEIDLMRRITPNLLHDLLKTITDLEPATKARASGAV